MFCFFVTKHFRRSLPPPTAKMLLDAQFLVKGAIHRWRQLNFGGFLLLPLPLVSSSVPKLCNLPSSFGQNLSNPHSRLSADVIYGWPLRFPSSSSNFSVMRDICTCAVISAFPSSSLVSSSQKKKRQTNKELVIIRGSRELDPLRSISWADRAHSVRPISFWSKSIWFLKCNGFVNTPSNQCHTHKVNIV